MFSSFKLFQTAQNQLDHKQLFSLINSMPDGFIAVDDNNRVILGNSAALNLLDANHLEGQNLNDILPLVDSAGNPVDIIKSRPDFTSPFSSSDYLLKRPNGDSTKLDITVSPIISAYKDARISGRVVVLRNTSGNTTEAPVVAKT